jgi:hypothetical protein
MGVTFYVMLTGAFPWKRAAFDDKNFDAFLRRDYSRGPWSRFSPELCEVCPLVAVVMMIVDVLSVL